MGSTLTERVSCPGLSYSRWAVELGTIVQYSGLDPAWQHLAMFKLVQLVRTTFTVIPELL